jgi:hypothetical protein
MRDANNYCPAATLAAILLCTAPLGASAQSESAGTDSQMAGRVRLQNRHRSHAGPFGVPLFLRPDDPRLLGNPRVDNR